MRDQRGFSLSETLAALLVVTLVITVTLLAFVERNKRLQQAAEIVLAAQALANESEYRRRIPYAELDTSSPAFLSDTALLAGLEGMGAAVKVELKKPGVKLVTMTIRWKNGVREARLELVRVDTGGSNLW